MLIRVLGVPNAQAVINKVDLATTGAAMEPAVQAGAEIVRTAMEATTAWSDVSGVARASMQVFDDEGVTGARTASAAAGSDVYYLQFQEDGTSKMEANPWARPAADESEAAVIAEVAALIMGNIG